MNEDVLKGKWKEPESVSLHRLQAHGFRKKK